MPVPKRQDYWIIQSTKDKESTFDALYTIGKELGRTPTATVFKCQRKGLPQAWSVKILTKNLDKKVQWADVGVLLKLEYRNLIRLKEIFESKSQIYLVQELVTGGELLDRLVNVGGYCEATAAKAINDVIHGLVYLHEHGIVHRNLKPENLLYENLSQESPLKIADYGLSSIISQEIDMISVCGAPTYTAPEVLRGEKYGAAGDMWSVGIILYILLCGYEPFSDNDPKTLFKKIMKGDYEFSSPHWDLITGNAQDLVRKFLQLNPDRRLTAWGATKNCWVIGYTANVIRLDATLARIKEFNEQRKKKAWLPPLPVATSCPVQNPEMLIRTEMMPVAHTPRSRPNSRFTLPCTPMPDIEIQISQEDCASPIQDEQE